jgi:hypothetical protein
MDLDQLKEQLKFKLETDHTGRTDEDIAIILKKKTSSILEKLKRNLWYETVFGFLFTIAFAVIGLITRYHSIKIYFSVFAVVFTVIMLLMVYLLKKTILLNSADLPIKSNLQNYVWFIEEFIKRYFQLTIALVPISGIFAGYLGYREKAPIPFLDNVLGIGHLGIGIIITICLVYLVGLTIGIYHFTKWYLHKVYGRYVLELKKCIAELQNNLD